MRDLDDLPLSVADRAVEALGTIALAAIDQFPNATRRDATKG